MPVCINPSKIILPIPEKYFEPVKTVSQSKNEMEEMHLACNLLPKPRLFESTKTMIRPAQVNKECTYMTPSAPIETPMKCQFAPPQPSLNSLSMNMESPYPPCNRPQMQCYQSMFTTTPSREMNRREFLREKYVESLNLTKDEKYFELLRPYKHYRTSQMDELYQKTTYIFKCGYDDCDKVFTKACNFLDHVRMHEKIRPYQCDKCDKEFVQKCNMVKHVKRHEASSLEERKVFKCSQCDKRFTERYNLKTHMKVHGVQSENSEVRSDN